LFKKIYNFISIWYNKIDIEYLSCYINNINNYTISSCSIYKNSEAIVTAGKTKPTKGTKIEGK